MISENPTYILSKGEGRWSGKIRECAIASKPAVVYRYYTVIALAGQARKAFLSSGNTNNATRIKRVPTSVDFSGQIPASSWRMVVFRALWQAVDGLPMAAHTLLTAADKPSAGHSLHSKQIVP